MNVSLPETLKSYLDHQVLAGGYGTSSEYVRELIRRDQDRTHLRNLLLEGAASPPAEVADDLFFDGLRESVRNRPKK